MNTNAIKKLRTSGFHLGTWLSLGSPAICELAGLCGFDWLLIDLEHGAVGESALFQSLQALRGSESAIIVRVGAPHPDLIQRVLDWGADGIMIPHVDTLAQAQACVKSAHFPPQGTRGYSRSVRACDYGMKGLDTTETPYVIAQIESLTAVDNAAAIASVEGLDALFVGPADLTFDLKVSGATIFFEEALTRVSLAASNAGIQAGILNRDQNEISSLNKMGYSLQAVDSDLAILRRRYQELVASLSQ